MTRTRPTFARLCAASGWDETPPVDTEPELPPLPRPQGHRYDDHFYELVAGHYRARLKAGKRPAQEIAKASGVPVTTVHRWVRAARRRGFLAATTRGRAG